MPVFQQRTKIHIFIGLDSWILLKLLQSSTGISIKQICYIKQILRKINRKFTIYFTNVFRLI